MAAGSEKSGKGRADDKAPEADDDALVRCAWSLSTAQYRAYHDQEWGVPMRDPAQLFQLLMLEGMQAGLTWRLILERRPQLLRAFLNFDPLRLSRTRAGKVDTIMTAPGVIKHRGKIAAVIGNAREYVRLTAQLAASGEDFSSFLWQFVDGEPIDNRFSSMAEVPAQTAASQAMSKALKREGFKFVGPTICYAFMQSAGMVNDHLLACFRHNEVGMEQGKA